MRYLKIYCKEYNSLFDNLLKLNSSLLLKEKGIFTIINIEPNLFSVLSFFIKGELDEFNEWSKKNPDFLKI